MLWSLQRKPLHGHHGNSHSTICSNFVFVNFFARDFIVKIAVYLCDNHSGRSFNSSFVPFLLPQFAVLLSLIVIVEIAAAIVGYVFRNKVSVEYICFM